MTSTFAVSSRTRRLAVGARTVVLAGLFAVVLVLMGGVGSAQAAKGIVGVVGAFTDQSGSGAGEFLSPAGVAVAEGSGDVYVVDSGNERIQQFDSDGIFIRAWGWDVVESGPSDTPSGEFEVCSAAAGDVCKNGAPGGGDGQFALGADFGDRTGIAVAPDGSVYVADTQNHRVQKFTADGAFVYTFGLNVDPAGDPDAPTFEICTGGCQAGSPGGNDGEFSSPISVAVDPLTSDVLVADRDNVRIQRFDSAGAYLSQFSPPVAPIRVAVDAAGSIYVLEPDLSQVQKYDSTGTPVEVLGAGLDPNPIGAPEDLAAAGDRVFVGQLDTTQAPLRAEVLEFDPTSSPAQLVDRHRVESGTAGAVLGLAAHPSNGRVYINLRAENEQGNPFPRIFILDEGGVPPAQVTLLPAVAETTTAQLSVEINSNGGLPTDYRIEVSPDGINWTTVDSGSVPGGNTDHLITTQATGLRPNTLYRFRVITNKGFNSPDAISPESTFLTDPAPPDILEARATSPDTNSVTLQGRINPNSSPTSYRFDYGIGAFNRSIPIPNAQIGSGPDPVFVSQALRGLRPNSTYQFRLVATNPHGTTTSTTKTFTTAPAPPDDRAYELVSPPDKAGGVGVGNWYAHAAAVAVVGVAAQELERFAVQGTQGATLSDDGAYSFANDWTFAERTANGWTNRPAISRRAHGPQLYTFAIMTAANEALSLTSWASNAHILRLFPEMESWDDTSGVQAKPLRRWTEDGWEIFDPMNPDERVDINTVQGRQLATGPTAIADDGSAIAASGSTTRGLAGSRDPTGRDPSTGLFWPDLQAGQSVYLDEVTSAFLDVFPGDDGVRELVNVCTGAGSERTVLPTGSCAELPGRDTLISAGGASLSPNEDAVRGRVMSDDGARVFFMSPDPAVTSLSGDDAVRDAQLYVRQRNVDGSVVTRWISRSEVEGQPTSLMDPVLFEGASRDGDKVFFRTTSPLTADDPNGACGAPCTSGSPDPDSADLYMYDLPAGSDPADGDLTRISAGPDGAGDCNSPEAVDSDDFERVGALRFVSDDGSRAYFTCAAPLAGVSESAGGSVAVPSGNVTSEDASNLYVFDTARPVAQRWRFIARLPRESTLGRCATEAVGIGPALVARPNAVGVNVSSSANCMSGVDDGSLVTFFTDGRLTGDDPDGVSGDMYGYDLAGNQLTRLSAPQGGVGGRYPCAPPSNSVQCFGDSGIGNTGMPLARLGVATRPNGDRLAFFQSRSRLVAGDTDDAYDVYQWREGELSLVSTGVSDTDGAMFIDNDRSGLNVYFATRDQLSWQDGDRVLDVYTARIGGGIPEPVPPVVCATLTDGCQGGGAGPVIPAPKTSAPGAGGGDVVLGKRATVSLLRLSAAQRRRAARNGVLSVRVRTSKAGVVRVGARARIGGRSRRVGSASRRVRRAGVARIGVRLSLRARRELRRGGALDVGLRVTLSGALARSMTVRLPGVKS